MPKDLDLKKLPKKYWPKTEDGEIVVDEPAYPIGGTKSIMKQIYYPDSARKNKVKGKVVASFTIDINGEAKNLKIIESIGHGTDEVVLEAIRNANYRPAMKDGEPTECIINFPVQFKFSLFTRQNLFVWFATVLILVVLYQFI